MVSSKPSVVADAGWRDLKASSRLCSMPAFRPCREARREEAIHDRRLIALWSDRRRKFGGMTLVSAPCFVFE